MNNAERAAELRSEIEERKSELSELKGSKKTLLQQLKRDFGCSSVSSAKKKLREMKIELKKSEENLEEKINQFEDEWKEQLDQAD